MREKIQEAIDKIRDDPGLQERFKENPKKTLSDLGLDTDQLKFCRPGTTEELSDEELDGVAGGVSVCGGFAANFVHAKAGG